MPIITMLVTSGRRRRGRWRRRRSVAGPIAEAVARDQTWPTISPAVRLRTRRCVPVWQKVQVSVQPTWLDTHSVPRPALGNVDAFDLVRPLAPVLAGQPQQPFARAVDGDLLGHDLRPRRA